jgi:hypothetical protein
VAVATLVLPQQMKTHAPAFGDIGVALHLAAYNQVWQECMQTVKQEDRGCANLPLPKSTASPFPADGSRCLTALSSDR